MKCRESKNFQFFFKHISRRREIFFSHPLSLHSLPLIPSVTSIHAHSPIFLLSFSSLSFSLHPLWSSDPLLSSSSLFSLLFSSSSLFPLHLLSSLFSLLSLLFIISITPSHTQSTHSSSPDSTQILWDTTIFNYHYIPLNISKHDSALFYFFFFLITEDSILSVAISFPSLIQVAHHKLSCWMQNSSSYII